jgi:hypothetical protein
MSTFPSLKLSVPVLMVALDHLDDRVLIKNEE